LHAAREAADRARDGTAVTPRPFARTLSSRPPAPPAKNSKKKADAERAENSSANKAAGQDERPPAETTAPAREAAANPPLPPPTRPPARTGTLHSIPSGLQRVQPGSLGDSLRRSSLASPSPIAAGCRCRVRGTVELEFHHLLSSPMRVEVSIPENETQRDTLELFMGSPRAFEFLGVPCGRLSLAVRPLTARQFEVITPLDVAPFECRNGSLRQVRIVLEPR
jgi:hypothetical protein